MGVRGVRYVTRPSAKIKIGMPTPLNALPTWEEASQDYACPDWFRDAKFGIWAHWGPQCQGAQGDHYAAGLYGIPDVETPYVTGDEIYRYHLHRYGHPSQVGFKDVIRDWKAEHWDPDGLMDLYARAGAKYFYCLGNHHDNLDNWRSKHHEWNSVNVGPQRDLVGEWAAAARKRNLHFGVSIHAWQAPLYYAGARQSDKSGPWAGVPYDGALTKGDGAGQWWDGLDPRILYAVDQEIGQPDAAWAENFHLRTLDMIESYRPDLIYIDNWDRSDYGGEGHMRVAAQLYRQSQNQAVYQRKHLAPEERSRITWTVERGLLDSIQPHPWQLDTCIGHWHYKFGARYKSVETVIRMLVDVVSKNGNLLLNFPLKGDGTLDVEELEILKALESWFAINAEAIHGTRPWRVFGDAESGIDDKGPSWNEDSKIAALENAVRYTAKGDTVYAFYLGVPDGPITFKSIETGTSVEQLGAGAVPFRMTNDGLVVDPKPTVSKAAIVFKVI